ncbi:SLATT domain-containing protein [Kitasatospora sp. NPDC101157]|uniref:SLATT domain-containing protein n=1 Tax=Kitasatospora sp. NPDC101157 TaxID=3364098 RepID=UPI0037F98649
MRSDDGPGAGLTPQETAALLLGKIRQGHDYARGKKEQFRRRASVIKLLTLAFSAASTILLGLQRWTDLAFALVALVTALTAAEPFYNWRSRWVLMEEAQYRFRRLADDLEYLVASTAPEGLERPRLDAVFDRYQAVWDDLSRTWLEQRREAVPPSST